MKNPEVFEKFLAVYREMKNYELAASRIHWDMETVAPKKAIKREIEVLTFLRTKIFAMSTDPEYGSWLHTLMEPENFDALEPVWRYTVRKKAKQYDNFINIPAEFYKKTVSDRATSEHKWQEAKRTNNFALWAPYLKQEIENAKQTCAYTDPGKDVYDTLISNREEGMTCETIDKVFDELKEGLKELLPRIFAKPEPDETKFHKHYDLDHQRAACRYLLQYIGFSFESGRMDEVEHPLTGGTGRNDVRVSNHYYEYDGVDPMFSIIHEGGHGLYNQNVAEELEGTDAEHAASAGLHESMSRFMENIVGRNLNFWKPIYADIQKLMPELKDITVEELYRKCNHVHPSPIRTRADEVTYCMHIILRHELEKIIFREDVDVMKLPEMWNDKMEELLGIRPANDQEGILQDLHWSAGYIGYFPTYLLGSIYDGMFLEAMEAELGPIDELLAKGGVLEVTGWLKENIHQFGGLYTAPEVIERVCHKPLSAKPLLRYFEKKYTEVYDL